jgi:Transposase, Mutator family
MVAALFRTVFAQTTPREVATRLETVAGMLAPQFPPAAAPLREAGPDLTAFADYPRAHWKKIWSTNPLERLNREVKRRADVVGVFPNPAALERLAGAILAEHHNEWNVQDERRYLSEASMAELYPASSTHELPLHSTRSRPPRHSRTRQPAAPHTPRATPQDGTSSGMLAICDQRSRAVLHPAGVTGRCFAVAPSCYGVLRVGEHVAGGSDQPLGGHARSSSDPDACAGCGQALLGADHDELSDELGQGGEDVEDQAPAGGGGVEDSRATR